MAGPGGEPLPLLSGPMRVDELFMTVPVRGLDSTDSMRCRSWADNCHSTVLPFERRLGFERNKSLASGLQPVNEDLGDALHQFMAKLMIAL